MTLFLLAVACLVGAASGALGLSAWWPAAVLAGIGLASLSVASARFREAATVLLVTGAALASLHHYQQAQGGLGPHGVAAYNEGDAMRLLGTVSAEPEERETTQRLEIDTAAVWMNGEWVETEGRVLATLRPFPRHAYGQIVEVTGELETPPVFEGFDYREYLARKGIVSTALFPTITVLDDTGGSTARKLLIETRGSLGTALERALPEPEAALAQGILLGQRSAIPEDVNEAFNDAGISHLIAISGYNVMLLAGAVIGVAAPIVGRKQATLLALVAIALYAAFVGGSPPVLRAALMAFVMLGATLAGRPGSALTAWPSRALCWSCGNR